MAATTAVIEEFTTDCAENHINPSTHTVASITTATEYKNRVGTSVEVPYTPLRVQNDAPEPLGGEKDPAPIGPESPHQVNLSKLSSLESNFDEGYDSASQALFDLPISHPILTSGKFWRQIRDRQMLNHTIEYS